MTEAEIVVCPPFTTLSAVVAAAAGSNIKVGAQNVHWAENGAFTGEISAEMLVSTGVEYVIIGHSERRQYFGETDATVNSRMKAALKAGLTAQGGSFAQNKPSRMHSTQMAPMATANRMLYPSAQYSAESGLSP